MRRILPVLLLCLAFSLFVVAQEHGSQHAAPAADGHSATPTPNAHTDQVLSHASNEAAGTQGHAAGDAHAAEGEDHGGHGQFLYSPTVRSLGAKLGMGPKAARWFFFAINFLIVAVFFWWIAKKFDLRGTLRARTDAIRKGMEEARQASEEANRRLANIQSRLDRLDSEIAEMRAQAERDSAAEEARIQAAAAEDQRKIVATAEAEIDSAAKAARRELKAYTADLAVQLAASRIQIDHQTDEALVRSFTGQLGNGKDSQ